MLTSGFLQFRATSEATGELFIIFLGDLLLVEELIGKCPLAVESMDIMILGCACVSLSH